MLIELDFNSEKPIYQQLYEAIILSMAHHTLLSGDSLPSVRSLGEEIGINLHTVNKAYARLKEEGYIQMDRRKGAIVSQLPIRPSEKHQEQFKDDFALLIAKAKLMGYSEDDIMTLSHQLYIRNGGNV